MKRGDTRPSLALNKVQIPENWSQSLPIRHALARAPTRESLRIIPPLPKVPLVYSPEILSLKKLTKPSVPLTLELIQDFPNAKGSVGFNYSHWTPLSWR